MERRLYVFAFFKKIALKNIKMPRNYEAFLYTPSVIKLSLKRHVTDIFVVYVNGMTNREVIA